MSLRKETLSATKWSTECTEDERLQQLYNIMSEAGVSAMSTQELEEWSYLMARSLEGKGDPSY